MTAFLVWFLPQVIRRVVEAQFNRVLSQFKLMCPVANSMQQRVVALEQKAAETGSEIAHHTLSLRRMKVEVEAHKVERDKEPELDLSVDGMARSY
jgi:hypothetical protein